jgi:hypothetical protein
VYPRKCKLGWKVRNGMDADLVALMELHEESEITFNSIETFRNRTIPEQLGILETSESFRNDWCGLEQFSISKQNMCPHSGFRKAIIRSTFREPNEDEIRSGMWSTGMSETRPKPSAHPSHGQGDTNWLNGLFNLHRPSSTALPGCGWDGLHFTAGSFPCARDQFESPTLPLYLSFPTDPTSWKVRFHFCCFVTNVWCFIVEQWDEREKELALRGMIHMRASVEIILFHCAKTRGISLSSTGNLGPCGRAKWIWFFHSTKG